MHLFKGSFLVISAVIIVILAVSTFFLSTPIYGDWWFVGTWLLLALLLMISIVSTRMWRRLPSLLLHTSFLLILLGGAATWLKAESGTMVLHKNESTDVYITKSQDVRQLPQPIALDSFVVDYYSGNGFIRDYKSYIKLDGQQKILSVNHPVDIGHIRLYQSSYLPDGSSVIGITDDFWGKSISFSGYILFALGGLLCLIAPKGRFRSLLRQLSIITALLTVPNIYAQNTYTPPQVVYNGRVTPLSTPATELLLKVSGHRTLAGIKAEDVMMSMLAYPDQWREKRFIYVKDSWLRDSLGIPGKYASLNDIFDADGTYRLRAWYDPQGDTKYDKAVLRLDEKVELIHRLYSGQLFMLLTKDTQPLPQWRVKIENLYNSVSFTKIYFMAALTMGIILLIVAILKINIRNVENILLLLLLLWQTTGYILRWIIYGRIPLGNTGETLVFISIFILILGMMIGRRESILLPLTVILSGFAALVANLSQSDPVVTPLVPVLSSPWLGIHVSLVMSAYSLLVFACILSAIGLKSERSTTLALTLLYPAVYLLGLGIFTGAVWAEVAWGRYWAWDPKETWALITFLVYAVPLHQSIRWFDNRRHLNIYILVSSLTMLMTYFGVNYLGGLHAYS